MYTISPHIFYCTVTQESNCTWLMKDAIVISKYGTCCKRLSVLCCEYLVTLYFLRRAQLHGKMHDSTEKYDIYLLCIRPKHNK